MSFIRRRVVVLVGVIAVAVAVAVPVALAWSVSGGLSADDKKMLGRLFRDGNNSDCQGKANPGLFANNFIRAYDVYRHRNPSLHHAVCFDVELTHNCGENAFAQANSPFTPLNPSAHYLGDAGQSGQSQSFSFTVGPGQWFDVVVGQVVSLHQSCHYTLTVEPAV